MTPPAVLSTARLRLRQWHDDDLDPWAALNADPQVREFFGAPLTRDESAASMARFRADLAARGWGWWALELTETGELIGMAGLDPVDESVPFEGVEAGWRLSRQAWGHGYATEAAQAVITYAFETLALPEVLAIAAAGNTRSHAVMRRIGMTHTADFEDPAEPPHLRQAVVYKIKNPSLVRP